MLEAIQFILSGIQTKYGIEEKQANSLVKERLKYYLAQFIKSNYGTEPIISAKTRIKNSAVAGGIMLLGSALSPISLAVGIPVMIIGIGYFASSKKIEYTTGKNKSNQVNEGREAAFSEENLIHVIPNNQLSRGHLDEVIANDYPKQLVATLFIAYEKQKNSLKPNLKKARKNFNALFKEVQRIVIVLEDKMNLEGLKYFSNALTCPKLKKIIMNVATGSNLISREACIDLIWIAIAIETLWKKKTVFSKALVRLFFDLLKRQRKNKVCSQEARYGEDAARNSVRNVCLSAAEQSQPVTTSKSNLSFGRDQNQTKDNPTVEILSITLNTRQVSALEEITKKVRKKFTEKDETLFNLLVEHTMVFCTKISQHNKVSDGVINIKKAFKKNPKTVSFMQKTTAGIAAPLITYPLAKEGGNFVGELAQSAIEAGGPVVTDPVSTIPIVGDVLVEKITTFLADTAQNVNDLTGVIVCIVSFLLLLPFIYSTTKCSLNITGKLIDKCLTSLLDINDTDQKLLNLLQQEPIARFFCVCIVFDQKNQPLGKNGFIFRKTGNVKRQLRIGSNEIKRITNEIKTKVKPNNQIDKAANNVFLEYLKAAIQLDSADKIELIDYLVSVVEILQKMLSKKGNSMYVLGKFICSVTPCPVSQKAEFQHTTTSEIQYNSLVSEGKDTARDHSAPPLLAKPGFAMDSTAYFSKAQQQRDNVACLIKRWEQKSNTNNSSTFYNLSASQTLNVKKEVQLQRQLFRNSH